jgi:trehalose 6-phosphate phosphatase
MSQTLPTMRADWALFLDVDGTLLDFAETPEQVSVPSGLPDLLRALHDFLGGALALVSGRPIATLDRLFVPLRLPAAGQHGAELRATALGEIVRTPPPSHLAEVSAGLRRFAATHPGILVEDKNASVAVHYRRAPQFRDELEAFTRAAIATNNEHMEILEAVMAFDVKLRSVDKGRAVAWFMNRPPFTGRVPVFIGDDHTDEYGFAEVAERAGYAIQVGTSRPRVTPWHIATPADLRQWLRAGFADLAATGARTSPKEAPCRG